MIREDGVLKITYKDGMISTKHKDGTSMYSIPQSN